MNQHITRMTRCSLFLSALALPALPALAQNLVSNGSFEEPALSQIWVQRLPGTTFAGWTVDNINSGIVQVASFGQPLPIDGTQCLELNFNTPCGVTQILATVPNRVYNVSFLMAGQLNAGPDVKSMRVDWAGLPLATVDWSRSANQGRWVRVNLCATATNVSTDLHFFGLTSVDGGPYLDDVRVVAAGCPADFDDGSGSGVPDCGVTVDDLLYYLDIFAQGIVRADLDDGSGTGIADGGVTIDDLLYFLVRYADGC